jgi:PAS domain S-box-containing protein
LSGIRVVIVDDEPEIGLFIKVKLMSEAPHFDIVIKSGGLECLDYLKKNGADCILSDYQMPGMDGMVLLREIKRIGYGIPFIFVTGQGNEELAREAFKNGAYDYFTKEIGFAHFTRIINSIEQAVSHRHVIEERKKLENELMLVREAVESLPIGITISDLTGRIIYTNPAEARMHGYSVDELIGRDSKVLAPPGMWKPRSFDQIYNSGAWKRTATNVRKNGELFPVVLTSIAVKDAAGTPIGIITACEGGE